MTSEINQLPSEHENNEQQGSASTDGHVQRSTSSGANIGVSGDGQIKPSVRARKTFGDLLERERVLW